MRRKLMDQELKIKGSEWWFDRFTSSTLPIFCRPRPVFCFTFLGTDIRAADAAQGWISKAAQVDPWGCSCPVNAAKARSCSCRATCSSGTSSFNIDYHGLLPLPSTSYRAPHNHIYSLLHPCTSIAYNPNKINNSRNKITSSHTKY